MPRSKPEFPVPAPQPAPTLSRWGRIQRSFAAHLATAIFTATLSYGVAAEDAHRAVAAERATQQQLAIYAGCMSTDPTGAPYWHQFPTAMDDATGEPIKAKREPRAKLVRAKQ